MGDGLVIFYKRLELGTFEMPQGLHAADGVAGVEMRLSELTLILEGIELSSVRRPSAGDANSAGLNVFSTFGSPR